MMQKNVRPDKTRVCNHNILCRLTHHSLAVDRASFFIMPTHENTMKYKRLKPYTVHFNDRGPWGNWHPPFPPQPSLLCWSLKPVFQLLRVKANKKRVYKEKLLCYYILRNLALNASSPASPQHTVRGKSVVHLMPISPYHEQRASDFHHMVFISFWTRFHVSIADV